MQADYWHGEVHQQMQPFGGKKKSRGDPIVVAQDIHPILVMQQPSQQEDPRRQQTDDMVTLKGHLCCTSPLLVMSSFWYYFLEINHRDAFFFWVQFQLPNLNWAKQKYLCTWQPCLFSIVAEHKPNLECIFLSNCVASQRAPLD